eukprot:CAMPEP_0198656564 /NCGR_PEP_ID=MMETSP1467-20131203/10117_1 /TAXON_ID=1462469 /ORGANISM="unid. sp., Strain CCMP2135" /LENGTH=476 /DNA_ID=CAMNT_0044392609 /DNA_START=44 /DNA_END=1471 /DNA_ORIENTATION=+
MRALLRRGWCVVGGRATGLERLERLAHSKRRCLASWSPQRSREEEDVGLIRESVAAFAERTLKPLVSEMDERGEMAPEVIAGLFEQGLMGINVEESRGGAGLSLVHCCAAVEEIAKVDPSVAVLVDIQNTLVNHCVSKWGSERQKEEWLPRLATDTASSFCLSEPQSGSDAFALTTRADKSGDDYVLNGAKSWISNAREAGLFLVTANADFSRGYRGITCFLVPRDTPGLSVGPPEQKLGIKASSTCPVFLEDVRVPSSRVLGAEGSGYRIAISSLNEGRVGIAAQMIGLAQGALDIALPYLEERSQFGQPLAAFQGLQFQVAQAATELQAARVLTYDVARRVVHDHDPTVVRDAAMAKLFSSQVAERVASRCVEWLGAVGFTTAYPAEKFYRDAKIGAIYEGTSNIQLHTIAKHLFSSSASSSSSRERGGGNAPSSDTPAFFGAPFCEHDPLRMALPEHFQEVSGTSPGRFPERS